MADDLGPAPRQQTTSSAEPDSRVDESTALKILRCPRPFPWREAAATGADLLWRVKSVAVLPVIEQLSDGSYLSHIFAARDKRHTNPITVRVVEYTMPGQAGVYRLITTILDPAAAPALALAALYAQRWEIETSLDELKTHQGQPGMVL